MGGVAFFARPLRPRSPTRVGGLPHDRAELRGRKEPASESGRYKRAELHAGLAKGLRNLGGDLWGAGGVAVDA